MGTLRASGIRFVIPLFLFADLGTFAYLMWEDWPHIDAWWKWPLFLTINAFLGTIWPIYWLLLRWIA